MTHLICWLVSIPWFAIIAAGIFPFYLTRILSLWGQWCKLQRNGFSVWICTQALISVLTCVQINKKDGNRYCRILTYIAVRNLLHSISVKMLNESKCSIVLTAFDSLFNCFTTIFSFKGRLNTKYFHPVDKIWIWCLSIR